MFKEKINMTSSKLLIGLTARTNNKNELNPATAKIGALVDSYHKHNIASKFNSRVNPGVTIIAYSECENNEHGEYTVFVGEEVESIQDQDMLQFRQLVIPTGNYQKFTTNPGKLPDIVIQSWQQIWQLTNTDLGGRRKFHTDFEIYDSRASDPANAIIDIYVGIIDE